MCDLTYRHFAFLWLFRVEFTFILSNMQKQCNLYVTYTHWWHILHAKCAHKLCHLLTHLPRVKLTPKLEWINWGARNALNSTKRFFCSVCYARRGALTSPINGRRASARYCYNSRNRPVCIRRRRVIVKIVGAWECTVIMIPYVLTRNPVSVAVLRGFLHRGCRSYHGAGSH